MHTIDEAQPKTTSFWLRPWVWIVGIVGVVLLTLAFAALFFVWWRVEQVPDIGEPFDVQEILSVNVPDADNAMIVYRDANSHIVELSTIIARDPDRDDAAWESYDKAIAGNFDAANEDVRHWLDANRTALAIWKTGTERPDCLAVHPSEITLTSNLDAVQSLRDICRVAMLEASRLLAEGKTQESWEMYRATLRCSRHAAMHGSMIQRLIGAAIHALAIEPIPAWAADEKVTVEQLETALADVQSIYAMTPQASVGLKVECLVIQSQLESINDASGRIPGERERARRLFNLIGANWLRHIDSPRWERPPFAPVRLNLFEPAPTAPSDPNAIPPQTIEALCQGMYSRLLEQVLPSWGGLDMAVSREQARQGTVVVLLAAQIHARRHGKFPASITELEGTILKQLPRDPYGKGEPIRYAIQPDGNAIVWSIGPDLTDDAGSDFYVPTQKGDIVLRMKALQSSSDVP